MNQTTIGLLGNHIVKDRAQVPSFGCVQCTSRSHCNRKGQLWGKQLVAARDDPEFGLDLAAQALGAARQEEATRRHKVVIEMNTCSLIVFSAIFV
jgi:hypothetical protein